MMWLSRERLLESAGVTHGLCADNLGPNTPRNVPSSVPVPFMIFLHHQGREPAQPQKSDLIKRMSRGREERVCNFC